jgi:hypothetical protein
MDLVITYFMSCHRPVFRHLRIFGLKLWVNCGDKYNRLFRTVTFSMDQYLIEIYSVILQIKLGNRQADKPARPSMYASTSYVL